MLRQPLLFTFWLSEYPVFLFTPIFSTQSARLPLATYTWLCSTYVTYAASCHAIGHQVHPTPVFNVIPDPSVTYRQVFRPISYFQPSSSQSDSGYTRQDRRSFAGGKDFNKKHRAAATLISSYESRNQNNCSLQNAFQNMGALQNCSLEKWISKLLSKICA